MSILGLMAINQLTFGIFGNYAFDKFMKENPDFFVEKDEQYEKIMKGKPFKVLEICNVLSGGTVMTAILMAVKPLMNEV